MPTTDILIVSCAKHFPWLRYCLKSIVRFSKGFHQVKILVPDDDLSAMSPLLTELSTDFGPPIRIQAFKDWPGKGFLRHEHIVMCADEYSEADFILHTDSDCVFTEPFSPADYFIDGKPVLMYGSYHWLVTTQQANLGMWQEAVERAVGAPSVNEFMRRHPAVHYRQLYPLARARMQAHTGMDPADFIASCREEFPQGFCEFNTLGEVAWRYLHDDYRWWSQEKEGFIKPHKIVQFSSGNSPANIVFDVNSPQRPYYRDQPFECTPESLLKIV